MDARSHRNAQGIAAQQTRRKELALAVGVGALGACAVALLPRSLGALVAALAAAAAVVATARLVRRAAGGAAWRAVEVARLEAARTREDRDALQRTLAHDLRSPLGAIVNFVSVLEEDHSERMGSEARGIVARIRRAAESGLRLADGLSRLSKVSRETVRLETVDVEKLVREVFEQLAPPPRSAELSLVDVPPATADRALLREAFGELIGNALKFSGRREKAHIAAGGRREADGTTVYWVADDGVGFEAAHAARLFRPFERLHSRDEFPGAGIGLAVVKRVAERHGGSVWAEGDPEHGARFYLSLPSGASS